ncbi:C4-dicarboxylate TRAP transporter substrate-binding protein [Pseudoroseicyclus sp. CXY001]|uniref:C4-dicarboxylate TRAP transporter substrate-binding protein n=1 Tax=Pseudoroseicyclus sp. CXY001 TaxID=3242492 RepID=UPI00357139AE
MKHLTAASVLALCVGSAALAQDFTLNINTALATSDPLYAGLEALRDNVAEASGGQLAIVLYPNSQLGPDEDVLEQARAGAPVAVVVDGGRLAVYQEEMGILGAPFLASGYEGIRNVVTSDVFQGWVDEMADTSGLQVLSFNWWQGERHLLTNKAITGPEDLAGIRMRTPGAPVWMGTIEAMGATPTPMPWADVYSALSSNVIDGAEAQFPAIVGANLQEVIDHVTKTGHINLITGLVTSAQWFDTLPEDLQAILLEESLKAGDIASYGTQDSLDAIEQQLVDAGVTVDEIDTAIFRDATAKVYDDLGYGDLRDQVQAIAAGN